MILSSTTNGTCRLPGKALFMCLQSFTTIVAFSPVQSLRALPVQHHPRDHPLQLLSPPPPPPPPPPPRLFQDGTTHRYLYQQELLAVAIGDAEDVYLERKVDNHVDKNNLKNKDDDGATYTIQILMSDTGGGHRASANAIRDALDVLYPGQFECDIVDLYTEYGPFWPYNDYPRMYKIMAHHSWMWDVFYKFGETVYGLALNEFLLTSFCYSSFKECLRRDHRSPSRAAAASATKSSKKPRRRADMVVSVHPLCQDVPLKVLEELDGGSRTTPFVTVVTDLGGAHKTWFNADVDKCFVPSDVLNDKARSRGLQSSQIVQHGLPIRKGFWAMDDNQKGVNAQRPNDDQLGLPFFAKEKTDSGKLRQRKELSLRTKLGLQDNLPTCLVVGGGDGMGGIVDIAMALGQELGSTVDSNEGPNYQMVVVCGKNQHAQTTLEKEQWGDGVNVSIKGFVNNMDEYMKAADCLVTKAGPGTIAEASICGLPCMLFAYLPGQEEGNVPFVEDIGFGEYSSDPNVIGETVASWLESPEKLQAMKAAALEASRPQATLEIAKDLADFVFSTKQRSASSASAEKAMHEQ